MLALCTHSLRAADLAAAKRWYTALSGTTPYFDMPFYVGFSIGGYELGIRPAKGPVTAGSATTYWGVSALDAALARAQELGAELVEPATDVGGGIRVGAVRDPFGNVLGFIENPVFPVPAVGATVVAAGPPSIAAADGQLAPTEVHAADRKSVV